MDTSEFRRIAKSVIDDIADYDESLERRPVMSCVEPGYLRELLPNSAPTEPEPFENIRADLHEMIIPGITHWGSPKFLAFFPCGTSYPASIAEMYSNAFSGAYFNWVCGPAVTELETIVLDWLAKALGLPECFLSSGPTNGGGVIHGSASESILVTMAAARDKYLDAQTSHLPEGELKEEETWRLRSRLVALGSSCVHSSTRRAAQMLGVRFVEVPASADEGYAMQGAALSKTVAELDSRGLEPFYLTATLGTTDVCAVDEFQGIGEVLQGRKVGQATVWVHVDAAYAGSALLLPANRKWANQLSLFNSLNIGPHKWMLTTFDCSVMYIRQRGDLVNALKIQPPYLQNKYTDMARVTDYRDWQISLGRRFRSLKLWFVMRAYGIRGLQTHIRNGIDLAESLEEKLRKRDDLFTVFTPAQFALLTFQLKGRKETEVTYWTKQFYNNLIERGDFYLTSTVVDNNYVIRVCTGGAGITEERVQELYAMLVEEAQRLLNYDPNCATPRG